MTSKDYIARLRTRDQDDLSTRLIDTFSKLRQQEGMKHADIVTRLKEHMEAALRPSTDAPD